MSTEAKKADKERLVLESAIHEVTDFIAYVEIASRKLFLIRHRDDNMRAEDGSLEFDYDYGVEKLIQLNIVDEDKNVCRRMFNLANVIDTVDKYGSFTGTFRVGVLNSSEVLYKRVTIYYLDSEQKTTLVAIQYDFTEIAKEDRQIQENIRGALYHAEETNRAKTRFLYSMSHEMRTTLNAIVVLSQLGKDRAADPNYLNYCFEKIDNSSKQMLDMIESVLDIVHIENDDMELAEDVIRFRPFIAKIADKVKAEANAKKIKVEVEIDDKVAQGFTFDAARLEKVLYNLLSNAIKFTPRFGNVILQVNLVYDDDDVQSLEFSVQDSGVGISEDFKPRVFQPFERELSEGSSTYGGAGLGLAICKQIVKRMGGAIEFDSFKGKGSLFRVNLDLNVTFVPPEEERDMAEDIFIGKRVLLADDNNMNLEIERQILVDQGMIVDMAENGQEALSQYMSNAPGTYDLILMDVRMPYMDGLTATKKIRASGKSDCKTVPILALTANASTEDVRKTFESGMNAHITKPVDVQDLFNTIRKALQGKMQTP